MIKQTLPDVFFPSKVLSNEFSIDHYGKHARLPNEAYGPFKREYFLIHYITSGKGLYRVKGKSFTINKGECFLIRPDEETYYKSDENEPWEYYFIAFGGTMSKKIIDAIDWTDGYVLKVKDTDFVTDVMKNICHKRKPGLWNDYMVLGNAYRLIAALIKSGKGESVTEITDEKDMLLNKAMDYIKENYSANLSVSDVARAVNMHRVSLYRLFKEKLNLSIEQYIQNYRMSKAAYLLTNSDLSIQRIGESVGLFDYPHFCRQFKKYYKFTPSSYRKSFTQSKDENFKED